MCRLPFFYLKRKKNLRALYVALDFIRIEEHSWSVPFFRMQCMPSTTTTNHWAYIYLQCNWTANTRRQDTFWWIYLGSKHLLATLHTQSRLHLISSTHSTCSTLAILANPHRKIDRIFCENDWRNTSWAADHFNLFGYVFWFNKTKQCKSLHIKSLRNTVGFVVVCYVWLLCLQMLFCFITVFFYVPSLCAIDLIAVLVCHRTTSELRFICHNSHFLHTHNFFYVNYFGYSTIIFDSQINMECVLIFILLRLTRIGFVRYFTSNSPSLHTHFRSLIVHIHTQYWSLALWRLLCSWQSWRQRKREREA